MAIKTKQEDLKQDVARWFDRIAVSRKWKESKETEYGWKRFIDEYKGKYDVVMGSINVPPINEVYAYIQSLIAILFAKNPFITINPKKQGSIAGAKILEVGVNHVWQEIKIKGEIEKEIVDAGLVGHAWHKTGEDVRLSGSGDILRLVSDRLFSNRVSWKDIFFNVGAMNPPKDCRWIAHQIYMPLEDLKDYFGEKGGKLRGVARPDISDEHYKNALFKDDLEYGRVYEIASAKDRKIYTIGDGLTDEYLVEPRDWPEHWDEFQIDMLAFNLINDEAYPLSDIAPQEPQILEKIKVLTMALNHVKRWNRQMLVKQGTLSPESLDKYEKGIEGSIIEVTGNPGEITQTIDYGSLPPDIYMIMDRLDGIRRVVSGMPETLQGGQFKTQTRTLGEVESVEGGAMGRIQRKIDVIETHCANVARKILGNIMNNFPLEMAVNLTGKPAEEIIAAFEGMAEFDPVLGTIKFSPEAIKSEYDLGVKAGSTLPLDKQTRDQVIDHLIELAIPLAQAPSIPPFLETLITERLESYNMPQLEVAFRKQQEAIAQNQQKEAQVASVETQKTAAEAAKRVAQAQQIETETDLARAGGMAKASGLAPLDIKL